jgi:hypothetical protein
LLTKEEARHAVGLEDYFVILPENISSLKQKKGLQKFLKRGKLLKSDFQFSSNESAKRLSQKTLLRLVEQMERTLSR